MSYLVAAAVLAVLGLQGVVVWILARGRGAGHAQDGSAALWQTLQGDVGQLAARLAEVELQVRGLPSLWEEERARSERAAERARKAAERAEKRRQEEDEEPEDELPFPDVAAGATGGVYPLRAGVEDAASPEEVLAQVRRQVVAHKLQSGLRR